MTQGAGHEGILYGDCFAPFHERGLATTQGRAMTQDEGTEQRRE